MKTASLQTKVLLVTAATMAAALAVSLFELTAVYRSIQDLDRISREDTQTQQSIMRAHLALRAQLQEWLNMLVRGRDWATAEPHWKAFLDQEKQVGEIAREARSFTANPELRDRLQKFTAAHAAAGERYRKGVEDYRQGKYNASALDSNLQGAEQEAARLLGEADIAATDLGAKAIFEAVTKAERAFVYAIVGTVAAVVIGLVALGFFVRRSVIHPLGDAVRIAERIAQGDLTGDIRAKGRDEAGQLVAALGRMNSSLAGVVTQVRGAADAVVTASSQVSAGTTDLSQRTEEQASSLEQTAASMEELASTVKQNAENARQADDLARTASKRAEQGGSEVVRVVTTMSEISDSARRIADIISVIDGIAFQTNILALNAAVEAARAGEQGRGFAVVASEVRSLAQRSAQAAKEIKQLIGTSVEKVAAGTHLVEQAGDTIQALVIDVQRVSDLMGSIAEASAEQSRGVQQVNKTVTEMDRVVQQNASAVQQSAAAAEGMRRQAEALAHAVSAFRLTVDERLSTPALAPLPALETAPPRAAALAVARASAQPAAKPRKAVAAGADDWEEF